ncbi:hypothetical protein G9A89_021274 [Geosiphon pyriformis]|nr:hypothetical protein G9A89_021274 [Geosiphon pyriformis]
MPIKLILDSKSTGSIVMLQLVNQLGFKVDCAVMSQIITANKTKVRKGTAKEIQHWKVSAEIADKVTSYNMFDPVDEFQENYQQLCSTHQEQKQLSTEIQTS